MSTNNAAKHQLMKFTTGLLGIVCLATSACVTPVAPASTGMAGATDTLNAPAGKIQAQVSVSGLNTDQDLDLIITNATPRDILIPVSRDSEAGEYTFRLYRETPMGWNRLLHRPGYLTDPIAIEPGLVVPAGRDVQVPIGETIGAYITEGWYGSGGKLVVQVRYVPWPDTALAQPGETVQYSDAFPTSGSKVVTRTFVSVSPDPSRSLAFALSNNSEAALWIPVNCMPDTRPANAHPFSDDDYLSLQRQTPEGTWQVIRGIAKLCSMKDDPLRVESGQTVIVDASAAFQSLEAQLGLGNYRWDIVFYLEQEDNGAGTFDLREGRHVFSPVFQWEEQP